MSLSPWIYKVKRPEFILDEGEQFRYCTFENWILAYYPLKYFRKFLFALIVGVSPDPVAAIGALIISECSATPDRRTGSLFD